VVPVVGRHPEAAALRGNVQEDEHALLYADLLRDGVSAVGVLDEPVGQVDEGELIHLAELLEAVGDSIEQAPCSVGARSARYRHVRVCRSFSLSSRAEG
jgi:hypothetical protein